MQCILAPTLANANGTTVGFDAGATVGSWFTTLIATGEVTGGTAGFQMQESANGSTGWTNVGTPVSGLGSDAVSELIFWRTQRYVRAVGTGSGSVLLQLAIIGMDTPPGSNGTGWNLLIPPSVISGSSPTNPIYGDIIDTQGLSPMTDYILAVGPNQDSDIFNSIQTILEESDDQVSWDNFISFDDFIQPVNECQNTSNSINFRYLRPQFGVTYDSSPADNGVCLIAGTFSAPPIGGNGGGLLLTGVN